MPNIIVEKPMYFDILWEAFLTAYTGRQDTEGFHFSFVTKSIIARNGIVSQVLCFINSPVKMKTHDMKVCNPLLHHIFPS